MQLQTVQIGYGPQQRARAIEIAPSLCWTCRECFRGRMVGEVYEERNGEMVYLVKGESWRTLRIDPGFRQDFVTPSPTGPR